MPVHAYILVHAVPGRVTEALEAVRRIAEVKVAAAVTGPHDIIALIEAPDVPQLGDLVANKIQRAAGVASTLTCVVVR